MPNNLGDTLKQARKDIGMSQERLSKLSGISRKQIENIETGKTKCPHRKNLKVITQILNLDFQKLISEYSDKQICTEKNDIGKIIREAREKEMLTQYELSKLSGISSKQIRNIELGKTKRPQLLTLVILAKYLKLKAEDLILL